jgi:hypothetical protein
MENFWLTVAILVFLLVTYKCISDSFERWRMYYVFVLLALFTWLLRRYMRKRMEKHNRYLDEMAKKK